MMACFWVRLESGQRTGKKAKKGGVICERRFGAAGKIVKMGNDE
jgi:hypothetical protein